MRDKSSVIGWILIGLLFLGFMLYQGYEAKKYAEEYPELEQQAAAEQAKQDSIAQVRAAEIAARVSAERNDSTNALYAAHKGKAGKTVIENGLLKLTISNKGAQLVRAELLDKTYHDQRGENVVLFDGKDNQFQLLLEGKDDNLRTGDFFFEPTEVTKSSVTFRLPVAHGSLDIRYSLRPRSYLLDMDVQAVNLDGFFPAKTSTMDLVWSQRMRQQEKGYSFENRYSTVTYRRDDDKTKELSSSGSDVQKDGNDIEHGLYWMAFKTQFFSQILIADGSFGVDKISSVMEQEGSGYLKVYSAEVNAKFDPTGKTSTLMHWYIGPNKFSSLKDNQNMLNDSRDLDLQTIVYLGWPVVKWINRFIFLPVFDFMTGWGLNMGIVLLIITLVVKFAVYPLMRKSYMSSANMRVLKPKVDEISKKYPKQEDAMQKQQEVMQLYSQYGVSPMGGCLPMLIQMPIWIALFNFIPNAIELRGQSFLWSDDLSTYDDLISWGFHIWGIGDHLSLFCVLWCVSTFANTWISMRQQSYAATPETQQSMKMMKWFSYLMPLIFFFSFNSYSSGLNYYYFISGLISILMMWYLRKTTDDAKLLKKLEARFAQRKSQPHKTSSMMERMQRMAQQQQEIMRQQQEAQKNKQQKK